MTRLWPDGTPITVWSNPTNELTHFRWQRQTHPIAAIHKQWRVHTDWWRQQVWRDYFKLTTQTGLLVIIFYDKQSDQWFLQRLYD